MIVKLSTIMQLASALLLITSLGTNADYLDITHRGKLNFDSKFMSDNIIISASIEDDIDTIGAGLGYRDKLYQVYYGLEINQLEQPRAFVHGFYNLNRHIYDIEALALENETVIVVGYSNLITESFGFYANYKLGSTQFNIGLRKWF